MLSTAIFVYAATAPVNGYSGGSLYARMGGKMWIRQVNTKLIHFKKSLLKSKRSRTGLTATKSPLVTFAEMLAFQEDRRQTTVCSITIS